MKHSHDGITRLAAITGAASGIGKAIALGLLGRGFAVVAVDRDRGRRPPTHGVRARVLLTGHTGALRVDRKMLEDFHGWARQLEGVFRTLVAVPAEVNFALDPNFATLFPYRNPARPSDRLTLELRVTTTGRGTATPARASWCRPAGRSPPARRLLTSRRPRAESSTSWSRSRQVRTAATWSAPS
jgi:hypothetical protein